MKQELCLLIIYRRIYFHFCLGDLTVIEKLLAALERPYVQREDIKIYQIGSPEAAYKTFCGT